MVIQKALSRAGYVLDDEIDKSIPCCKVAFGGRHKDLKSPDNVKMTCDTMFCAIGKECVEMSGKPECECIEKCTGTEKPVCGSNGVTYKTECHLHQAECLNKENEAIMMVAPFSCEEGKKKEKDLTDNIEKDGKKVKPVICMQVERDELRRNISMWIKTKLGVEYEEVSYKGLLLKYFSSLDVNNDGGLDTLEFIKIMDTETDIIKTIPGDSNPVLRGLCVDEVIAVTDYNSDYKLEFDEFHDCLNPGFIQPKQFCEVNGMKYEDGEDILKECNTCKCSCGNWVCTSIKCDEDNNTAREKMLP